jgi:hypothetical protein
MNYKNLYQQFISSRPIRVKRYRSDPHLCRHHIIPRSIGGTDSKDNLITLTVKEHYFAHKLLYKMQPKGLAKSKMAGALWIMSSPNRFMKGARRYEIHQEKHRQLNREQALSHWQRPDYRAKFITPGSKGSRYNADGTRRIPIYTMNRSKEDRCSMLLAKWKRRGVKPNYGYLDKIMSA